MARVGRPRTNVDDQEIVGVFARMPKEDREIMLRVLSGVHTGLVAATRPKAEELPPETPSGEVTNK